VTELAEGPAVGGAIVATEAPGLDVRGVDRRVTVESQHAYAAQGAAMIVSRHDRMPEPLVTSNRTVRPLFVDRLRDVVLVSPQHFLAVPKHPVVYSPLLDKRGPHLGRKEGGLEEDGPKHIASPL